jgi:hypothetical protein
MESEELRRVIEIEPLALQEEYVRLPADMAYLNEQYAQAQKAYLYAKATADEVWARVWLESRTKLTAAGEKTTEALINATAATNREWLEAVERLTAADAERIRLRGHADAVGAKKEMLISLGAHIRSELEGDPQLRRDVRR